MRAFVAVDLPGSMLEALTRLQMLIPVGRKVAVENLHLTLAFLDEQPETVLEDLHAELERLPTQPLSLGVSGLGCFGGDKPRLLFADVPPGDVLKDLHGQFAAAARRVGISLRRERFHPHITLSRINGRLSFQEVGRLDAFLRDQGGVILPAERCPSFSLVQSTLGPKGARYDRLATYDLV